MNSGPFTPVTTGTTNIAVTGTSGRVALVKTSIPQTVMVTSLPGSGTTVAFIEFGDSTVAAVAATATPILAGAIYTFTVGAAVTHMAAIGTAGTTLYVTCGHGA